MTRSTASQNGKPPFAGLRQISPRSADGQHPGGDPQRRADQQVDPEPLQPPPDDQDRPPDGQQRAHDRDERQPEVGGVQTEHALGGHVGDLSHGPELDGRPPHELEQVEGRGQERAPQPEDRAEQHHGRHALALAGQADQGEWQAPDGRSHDDRQERLREPQRGDEQRAGDHHQQAHREVSPQDGEVDAGKPAAIGRDGTDAPGRRLALQDPLEALGEARHGSVGVYARGFPTPAREAASPGSRASGASAGA